MAVLKLIHGAGGAVGGGGNQKQQKARTPVIKQDNPELKTISFAKMQFLLCEGQIKGPAVGFEESVYLDETPIRTVNGVSPQPEDLVLSYGNPTAYQTAVPGYGTVSNLIGVDKIVKYGLPVTQQITATDPTVGYSARVLLTWQGLYLARTQGDRAGDVVKYDCDYGITYTDNLGVVRGPGVISLKDKFSGAFQKEAEFPLEGPGPWTVRVDRYQIDDDVKEASENTPNDYQSTFSFSSIVLSTWVALRYPHSAILTLGVRADQYSNIPAVAVDLYGKVIRIPNNYNPDTRAYTGLWNGGFIEAYTNNPAWILYDLFINDRYGLGQYIDPQLVDKWTLYEIAQYCDQWVPDGKGGYEPRFTCNIILQTAEEAWTVVQQFSSIFRGILYYASSTVVTVQDKVKNFVYTFNESNTIEQFGDDGTVSEGNFSYAGSAKRARHTAVLVSWDDPADNYQPRVEYIADDAGMLKLGYRPLQLRLMGVTSRGQAIRAANWALLVENLLDDTVAFATGAMGAALRPGDLIKVADPNKAAIRMGGRTLAVNGDGSIEVDQAPVNPPGGWAGATFSFMAADANGQPVLRASPLPAPVGNRLAPTWSTADRPLAGWPWLIEVPGRTAQEFRVLSITENVTDEEISYGITAIRYRSDIYDAVDFGSPLGDDGTALWKPAALTPPTITTAQVVWDGGQAKLDLVWTPPLSSTILGDFNLSVKHYRVQRQAGNIDEFGNISWDGVWIEGPPEADNVARIIVKDYVSSSRYRVKVAAVSRIGVQSEWSPIVIAKPLEEWWPMPDLVTYGRLRHTNLSTGGHTLTFDVTYSIPPYVSGKRIETLRNGVWETIAASAIAESAEIVFDSVSTKSLRAYLTTYVSGLQGKTYALDTIDRLEIAPPSPNTFRVALEGGAQSRSGQRRFSWEMGATPFAQNWPAGYANDVSSFDVRYIQGAVPNWDRAFPLFSDGIPGDQTWFATKLFDAGLWLVMIRAKDRTGWYSDEFAAVTVGIGDAIPSNAVQRFDLRDGAFPGQLDNLRVVATGQASALLYTAPLTDPIYFAPLDDQFYEGLTGAYLEQIDPALPSTYVAQIESRYEDSQLIIYTRGTATYRWFVASGGRDLSPMYPPLLSDSFYNNGPIVYSITPASLTRTGTGATAPPTPTGGTWQDALMYPVPSSTTGGGYHPYAANELVPQGISTLKLEVISLDGVTPGTIIDADVVLDYPDVVWTANDYAVPAGGRRLSFPSGTFRQLKAVSLSMQDDGTLPGIATNAVIVAKTAGYVDIAPLDSSGTPAAGIVDVIAVGW